WLVEIYILLLVFVSLKQPIRAPLSATHRLILISVFLVYAATLFVVIWVFEASRSLVSEVMAGRGVVSGVQGRYLIGFALPLLIGLSAGAFRTWKPIMTCFLLISIAGANFIAFRLILTTFYPHSL